MMVLVLGVLLVAGSGSSGPAPTLAAGNSQIYVVTSVGRIVRVDDMTGASRTTLGTLGSGVNQFDRPEGIFVDGAGRIYVADFHNGRVVRVNDMTGAGWTTLGTPGDGINQFHRPDGIFVDGAGRIYVTDFGNSRIVRVNDMTGAGWTTLGTPGTGVNQFNNPAGIFVDVAGRIYVADFNNSRVVQVNDMTGAGWTTLGSRGTRVNQFSTPEKIFVGGGRIYVTDFDFNNLGISRVVRVIDMTGAGWTTLGTYGTGVNQFSNPDGIFVDGAGRIYVADFSNSRVVRVNDMTGAGWTTLDFPGFTSGLFVH